ncbi:MAG TPA: pyridoxal phosphate-dependent aminotransferase [Acidimicrobiales bacterium]
MAGGNGRDEPIGSVPYLTSRLQGFGVTVFAEMSALAERTGAINLGQGFPDEDGPAVMIDAAVKAMRDGRNQYPPGPGMPELRQAISAHQQRFYGLAYDPDTEVLVTAGATEAIAAAVLALCEPGDEVVMFEPFFDSYAPAVAMAGARRRVVPLRPPGWGFDLEEFAAAVTPATRLVLLNSPHNPTGKVFDPDELAAIARVCVEADVQVVTDEVYEHLVFEWRHLPLASLPGMGERTITISSAGKTFSFTGWKIGWACGPAPLVAAVRTAKQFLTYVNGAPFQPAVAVGLGLPDEFFAGAAADLAARRDRLCVGLDDAGFDVLRPAATYFAMTDIRPFGQEDGVAFCRQLPERCGVVAIPASVLYDDKAAGRSLVRFAFCKRPEVIDDAVARLRTLAVG